MGWIETGKRTHLLYMGNFEVGKCLTRAEYLKSQIYNLVGGGGWFMMVVFLR